MLCKSCNTRLDDGTRVCPNCGHQESYLGQPGGAGRTTRGPASSSSRLSPSMYSPRKKPEDASAADLELEDAVEASRPAASQSMSGRKPIPKPGPRPTAPPTRSPSSSGSANRPARPAQRPVPKPAAVGSDLSLDPEQLLSIVCEEPELLEPGLQVYEDDAGKPLGVGFSTDVGDIDLLARSADGDWVIVSFDDGQADIMAAMLMRMGWVRKHLVKDGEAVRAIVIAERVDPEVGYAAAAMADSIEFKSCRLTLRFDTISV